MQFLASRLSQALVKHVAIQNVREAVSPRPYGLDQVLISQECQDSNIEVPAEHRSLSECGHGLRG
jgi:hypothetical protein